MALTKTRTTVQASASNTAGSTTTSAWLDVSGDYDAEVVGKITNGATGPTLACSVYLETIDAAETSGAEVRVDAATGMLGNSVVTSFRLSVPRGALKIRTVFTGNTGQTVTIVAFAERVTAI
jgi:hypothetical protein